MGSANRNQKMLSIHQKKNYVKQWAGNNEDMKAFLKLRNEKRKEILSRNSQITSVLTMKRIFMN